MDRRYVVSVCLFPLLSAVWPMCATAGSCAVSDASKSPSDDGCALAVAYNQDGDCRLVVLDGKARLNYEAPLDGPRLAPFWEGGKVYVLAHSGSVQGFSIVAHTLVPDRVETLCTNVVREADYSRAQHRLFVISTGWDAHQRTIYTLSAIDFPARRTLWTIQIDDPGLISVVGGHVSVMGLKLVEVFKADTGDKLGTVPAAKTAAETDPSPGK